MLSRYSACNGMEVSTANPYYDRLKIMWNAGEKKRKMWSWNLEFS